MSPKPARFGAQVVTLPPDILGKMISHPLTDKGLSAFLSDWEKVKKENPNLVIMSAPASKLDHFLWNIL